MQFIFLPLYGYPDRIPITPFYVPNTIFYEPCHYERPLSLSLIENIFTFQLPLKHKALKTFIS